MRHISEVHVTDEVVSRGSIWNTDLPSAKMRAPEEQRASVGRQFVTSWPGMPRAARDVLVPLGLRLLEPAQSSVGVYDPGLNTALFNTVKSFSDG